MKFIFIRHAATQFDPNQPPMKWKLSVEGEKQAQDLASDTITQSVDKIICSEELKTSQTILPYAEKYGIAIYKDSRLNEIGSRELPVSLEERNQGRKLCFKDLNLTIKQHSYESFLNCIKRFYAVFQQLTESTVD